jgi:hypothetical protein
LTQQGQSGQQGQTQQIQVTQSQTQSQNNQILTTRNLQHVMMGNQPVQLQVVDNATWVKYEIIQQDQME